VSEYGEVVSEYGEVVCGGLGAGAHLHSMTQCNRFSTVQCERMA
jgi:hypothetical protein